MAAAFLLLQAASQPAAPPLDLLDPPKLKVTSSCPTDSDGTIVVCGKAADRSPYRLPLPRNGDEQPNELRFRLPGGVAGDAHLEQGRMGDPRLMLRLTKKF